MSEIQRLVAEASLRADEANALEIWLKHHPEYVSSRITASAPDQEQPSTGSQPKAPDVRLSCSGTRIVAIEITERTEFDPANPDQPLRAELATKRRREEEIATDLQSEWTLRRPPRVPQLPKTDDSAIAEELRQIDRACVASADGDSHVIRIPRVLRVLRCGPQSAGHVWRDRPPSPAPDQICQAFEFGVRIIDEMSEPWGWPQSSDGIKDFILALKSELSSMSEDEEREIHLFGEIVAHRRRAENASGSIGGLMFEGQILDMSHQRCIAVLEALRHANRKFDHRWAEKHVLLVIWNTAIPDDEWLGDLLGAAPEIDSFVDQGELHVQDLLAEIDAVDYVLAASASTGRGMSPIRVVSGFQR